MQLYMLTFTDTTFSYEGHSEDFLIGIFETENQAKQIAEYYLEYVEGFNKYPIVYQIENVQICDETDEKEIPKTVYMIWAWDCNECQDEIHVVHSQCYASEETVRVEYERLKEKVSRQEWTVDEYQVGKNLWSEGFVRS